MARSGKKRSSERLDAVVAQAHAQRAERERGYRARALKMYPWVCGRCGREFTAANVHELTVHHRDHDHDNNPPDGSNWELLCLYCHDNEHARVLDAAHGPGRDPGPPGAADGDGHFPFAGLGSLIRRDESE